MRKYIYIAIAIAWTSFITFISLASLKDGPEFPFSFADKIAHGIVYFIFVIVWFFAFTRVEKNTVLQKKALLISFVFAVIYGICIEIMQGTLVSHRQSDWQDALANTIGAILAAILIKYYIAYNLKLKRKN